MTWTPSFTPSSATASPIRRFRSSDSTTQGPAMRNGAAPAAKCCATSVASAGELRRPLGLGGDGHAAGAMLLARRAHEPGEQRVLARPGELARVRVRELDHVARELDDRRLQAKTDPEEGQLVLPRPADRFEHSRDPAHAESARDEQAVVAAE